MSTPTTIRIRHIGMQFALVTTVYNPRTGNLDAHFQVYYGGGVENRTSLAREEVWSTEQDAIRAFDNWEKFAEESA